MKIKLKIEIKVSNSDYLGTKLNSFMQAYLMKKFFVVLVFSLLFVSDSGFADIRQPRQQNGETDDQKSSTRVDASTPCPFRCVVTSWRSLATTEPPTVES